MREVIHCYSHRIQSILFLQEIKKTVYKKLLYSKEAKK